MIAPGYRSEEVVRLASIYQQGGMRGPPEAPWCVTEQWLWNSIRIDARVGEKHYFPAHLGKSQTRPGSDGNANESCRASSPL